MRRSAQRLSLPVILLAAGLLVAGCGGTISSSIGGLPSRTATVSARPGVTVTVTSAPATGSAAPAASSGTSLTWLWVLLGVLVLAGLIALIARSARRRSAAVAGWRSRLVDAYAKGSALHDAMSVAEAPGGLAAADVTEIVCTNSAPVPADHLKLHVLSVAPALAEAINRIYNGESVSALFDN
jgi:Phosphoribosyl synthetase-associated domain